jgi:uncharacterized protein YbbC (DUF1343 family)
MIKIFLPVLIFSLSCLRDDVKPVAGAERLDQFAKFIRGKNIAVTANQTSLAGSVHLVDLLVENGFNVKKIFAPEHGFRDLADAGEKIADGIDQKTGIPVVSLYGSHLKPQPSDLTGIDVVIFDIQDVGVRFYTYIGTLHYIMEACSENNVKCIVFDRPNPNGFYVDGNIPDTANRSFVCMHPVPIVHGMTIGEYALMINGEGWLKGGKRCDLEVIKCLNYSHNTYYELPVRPSPNLPNQNSIYLYPSICFFEGTKISLGRGTGFPFQVYGSPLLPDKGFSFTPQSLPGAKNPPHSGVKCYGTDLSKALINGIVPDQAINLEWVIDAYSNYPDKNDFFKSYFDVLSGGPVIREQIISGMTSDQIRETWKEGIGEYLKMREKYLLYE